MDFQKWGLCYSQSTDPCQIPDLSRHATTAKGFTFCRCAELRPAPLTCANLLFAATTTCSSLTVCSRMYQRQPISASSFFHKNFTRLHKNPAWLLGSLSRTSVDFQKWGLCCSPSAGPCQIPTTRPCAPIQTPSGWSDSGEFAAALPTESVLWGIVTARDAIDVPRHATTAKEFTLCRCAELRPAPLTCANLLFAATTTCSFLTVSSRLYQQQPTSASSQPSATWDLVIWLRSFTMDKCPIPQPRRCASRFWHIFLEHRYFREPPTPVRVLGTTTMAFGQGTDVTGGYRSCPAVQCGATVTSGLRATRPVAPGGLLEPELQQARTRSLLPPVLIWAIPLRPNRRQILPTAWASSELWHSTALPWTSPPQSYAEFTAACLAPELRHPTTGYALPLGRSRNTKPRLRLGVSEITSPQDTVPVVTQIPQGWSPDSQIPAHSSPTCTSSTHSESFVCDSLLTPCACLRWQEVNLWHHGPLYICITPRTCLRLQEIKIRSRGPPTSSSTSSANFRWQEVKLRHPDPQCLHELFKITASSKPMPPPQGHEPMVHPLVLLTGRCFLHELRFLLPYCTT